MSRIAGRLVKVAAAVVAVMVLAMPAMAGVLFEADLDGGSNALKFKGEKVATERGPGWRSNTGEDDVVEFDSVEYRIDAGKEIDLESGSITLQAQRSREGGPTWDGGSTYNTLFTLLDADRNRILTAYVLWEFRGDHAVSGLCTDSPHSDLAGRLWGAWIPFTRKIGMGEWIELTFTWGPGENRVYLDGVELESSFAGWDGVENEPVNPSPRDASLADYAAGVRYLVLGSDVATKGTGAEKREEGSFHLYNTVLGSFAITDEAGMTATIAAVNHDADTVAGFSGALVEGDVLGVTLAGSRRGTAKVDIGRLPSSRGEIALDWRGYYDEDVNTIDLEDVDAYRVYLSRSYFTLEDVGRFRLASENKKVTLPAGAWQSITEVEELRARDMAQRYTINDLDNETPYFVMVTAADTGGTRNVVVDGAVVGTVDLEEAIVAPVGGIALKEKTDERGTYAGSWTVGGDVTYAEAVLIGSLTGADGVTVTMAAEESFAIDTSVRILVTSSPSLLKADERSTSRLTVEVRDANGDTVSGHKVALSLATTSEYTGVIGGGKLADAIGGELDLDFSGETDAFGTVQATFTAGFAAKTAIIVARDRRTSDVGSGYVRQYIEGTTDIELVGLRPSAAKVAGYAITVTADREWLTADGSSQAKITAQVLRNGSPVAGHTVVFSVVGEGRVKTVNAVTDGSGKARAVYTAGTKIGLVLVKATDVTVGLSGSVQIELRSDAPAKIAFAVQVLDPVSPEDSTGKGLPELYADGKSRANLAVLVTDANDNPNRDTTVSYAVIAGSGTLEQMRPVTDRDGKSYATFKAGNLPGTATVKVTVASNVPSGSDVAAAENAVLTVPDFEYITE